ncbi:MAG: tyrosine-type recombinase/integrase [Rickettsiales bacterium]
MALTDKTIKNAAPKSVKYKLADGEGMYLHIFPNGSKYWRLKYRVAGKERVLALGTYPLLSLAGAREKRYEARLMLSKGIDPSSAKQAEKRAKAYGAANTFEAVAADYFATYEKKWTKIHRDKMWRRLEIHVFSCFGNKPIKDIKRLEVLDMAKKVEKQTTHLSRRVLQLCKTIFNHAVMTERLDFNPASDLSKLLAPHKHINYPTLKPSEISQFFVDLEAAKTAPLNKLMIKLLMLTFVRQQELRYAYWEDVSIDEALWRVRAETMKMKEEHLVPLSRQAIKTLRQIQEYNGNYKHLFPSHRHSKSGVISEGTINMIIKRMGYKGRLVGHGFRAIASTVLNEQGSFPPDVIERQLAHGDKDETRAAYNRAEYLEPRTKMMQWWGDYLVKQGLKL